MDYLFRRWDNLKKKIQGKFIFLFLDFDGTLVPIVDYPNKVKISLKVKNLLKALSRRPNYRIAVISGRSLVDIKKQVGVKNLIYSGNHGLEVEGPKVKFTSAASSGYRNLLQSIRKKLEQKLLGVKGILIEDKGLSLALHFRNVSKMEVSPVKNIFREITREYLEANKIKTRLGKKVLEVSLPARWDKGKIVLWLLSRQRIITRGKEIMPVYIGDDITDEDAFKSLRKKGVTIFVGGNKLSRAEFYLKKPEEVREFLKRILND